MAFSQPSSVHKVPDDALVPKSCRVSQKREISINGSPGEIGEVCSGAIRSSPGEPHRNLPAPAQSPESLLGSCVTRFGRIYDVALGLPSCAACTVHGSPRFPTSRSSIEAWKAVIP